MDEHHASGEADEQIDLGGDNDIEDMMDEEDAAEDDGYRKVKDENSEDDNYRAVGDEYTKEDSHMDFRDEYTEDNNHEKAGDEYANDDSNGRVRDEYTKDDSNRKVIDNRTEDESCKVRDGHVEDKHGSEGEEPDNNTVSAETQNDFSEKPDGSKDEDDSEKRSELLALPPHGSEVFIGGLPRDMSEEDIRGLCEPFGEVFEVRLMKDKDTKESKGSAFVTFTTQDAAQDAIKDIQDKELKGRTLRCSLSEAKYRLFVGNVPKNLTEEELRNIFERTGPGVENVECFKDPQNPSRNRGFIFVEYYNHACADYARQKMISSSFKLDGSTPTVSWADPKSSADSSAAAQVKAIYLKNLPENVTSEKIKELFEHHGEITKVVLPPAKPGQKRDFGFIHFAERSSALKAVKGTEKYEIDGHVFEVTLAKPQAEKKSDHALNSQKAGVFSGYPLYPPYGGYGSGYGGQPIIYGRGPMPPGMRMVPMVLPDGRIGYVLQQSGTKDLPLPPRRSDRRSGRSSDSEDRSSDGSRGRKYRPY